MELHLKENERKVAPKCCPRCEITLTSTQRYKDHIKKSLKDLSKVVAKFKGTDEDYQKMNAELIHQISILRKDEHVVKVTRFLPILQTLEAVISNSKVSDRTLFISCSKKIKIIENIIGCLKKSYTENLDNQFDFLLKMLEKSEVHLTSQEQRDFKKEIKRWSLLEKISQIEKSKLFKLNGAAKYSQKLKICKEELFATKALNHSLEMSEFVGFLMKQFVIVEDELWKDATIEKDYWLKCSQDHVYPVDDISSTGETSQCPYCDKN
ncbi:hypothetical protein FQR65_LT14909 [Abscondita terminalis]|nr:hypothetical protein FQR65_LT14909 [Abscondita terminalis]